MASAHASRVPPQFGPSECYSLLLQLHVTRVTVTRQTREVYSPSPYHAPSRRPPRRTGEQKRFFARRCR